MKTVFCVALILCVQTLLVGQEAKKYSITATWDKFKDVRTTLLTPMSVERKKGVPVFMFAGFECPGIATCKPEGIVLGFAIVTWGDDEYRGDGIARCIRDGVRQDPYKLNYVGLIPSSIELPVPTYMFKALLRPEGLRKIANSKLVEYQIDSVEFTLTDDNLVALRDLASRMKQ